jgi:hypothetical protein
MTLSALAQHDPGLFVPEYRPMRSGAWELRQTPNVLCQGYWGPPVLVPCISALIRNGEVWMSITPMELESQAIGITEARGAVVIYGLGMGWAAAATALSADVTAVTVVEFDPAVIALHEELDIFAQLPPDARAKVRIEQGDAYAWRTQGAVDLLMPDIWLPLVSDGRVDEVGRMQENVRAKSIYFWGQEMEIARHAVAAGRAIDDAGIAATVADFGLPLAGLGTQDYAMRTAIAAERWMNGRWFDREGQTQ